MSADPGLAIDKRSLPRVPSTRDAWRPSSATLKIKLRRSDYTSRSEDAAMEMSSASLLLA